MKAIHVRNLPDDVVTSLNTNAAMSGLSREDWLREQLIQIAKSPFVPRKYNLQLYRAVTNELFVNITRGVVHPYLEVLGLTLCTDAEREVIQKAYQLLERNTIGDREGAIALLRNSGHFSSVVEVW